MIEAFPLHWPLGYSRTKYKQPARFDTSFAAARDGLIKEVKLFGGKSLVISSNIPIKNDGMPYASYRKPEDTGIAVYFIYNNEQVVFACDKWDKCEDNLQAIRKTIEAFRGQERWGVSELLKRTFTGFKELPEQSNAKPWWQVLGVQKNANVFQIKEAYRALAKIHHPDVGGNHALFQEINNAYQQALKSFEK